MKFQNDNFSKDDRETQFSGCFRGFIFMKKKTRHNHNRKKRTLFEDKNGNNSFQFEQKGEEIVDNSDKP